MNLPKDPIMLASVLNTKLRDKYSNLSELCDREDISETELNERLTLAGLTYDSESNRIS